MSPWGAPEGVQPTRGGPLTPSLPGRCPLTAVASWDRTGQGWEQVPPRESPSLVPQFPHRAAGWRRGRGTATLTFGWVAGKSPRLLCATAQAGTGSPRGYGRGTSVGTHPIACAPGLPRCHQPQPQDAGMCQRQGTVQCPGLCPAALALPRLWAVFPVENSTKPKVSPRENRGLPPAPPRHSLQPRHRCSALHVPDSAMVLPGGTWASRAPLPAPLGEHSRGVPMQGDSGVTSSQSGGAHPLMGCPGQGTGTGRCWWRWC